MLNLMRLYNANPDINSTKDTHNGVRLRVDLHHVLDNYLFVPYPSSDRFVAVFLKNSIGYAESYHRRFIEINSEVSV